MAKIDFYVPEPSEVYNKDTQRQIIQALDTLKSQLNTSYGEESSENFQTFSWFLIGTGKAKRTSISNGTSVTGTQLTINKGQVVATTGFDVTGIPLAMSVGSVTVLLT
jgi:CRISPR/Cas system endoribonuclease Cas6 (RAMP superfamily)